MGQKLPNTLTKLAVLQKKKKKKSQREMSLWKMYCSDSCNIVDYNRTVLIMYIYKYNFLKSTRERPHVLWCSVMNQTYTAYGQR